MTEVRSFIGFVSYYRRFIPNVSKIDRPLNQLLQNVEGTSNKKKRFQVHWETEQQEAFKNLQKPILDYANFKASVILHTHASGKGFGAILYQNQEEKRG